MKQFLGSSLICVGNLDFCSLVISCPQIARRSFVRDTININRPSSRTHDGMLHQKIANRYPNVTHSNSEEPIFVSIISSQN